MLLLITVALKIFDKPLLKDIDDNLTEIAKRETRLIDFATFGTWDILLLADPEPIPRLRALLMVGTFTNDYLLYFNSTYKEGIILPGSIYVADVIVPYRHRRQGWGRKLIRMLKYEFRDVYFPMYLEVDGYNVVAKKLYESEGFDTLMYSNKNNRYLLRYIRDCNIIDFSKLIK